ncbi:sporulation membrane protein YtaF [Pseudobacillus badius]|uniref:sporulation membrane protein YtaF n=2 Tax=Bacillus badius TaxID=1455 RepID=UPI000B429844|nr:sporulation membrane protein YtaF [Bacillus badius]MED0666448.1 sporulation membrane protein YtaF [Bacillus badius]OVE51146.1 sporulation membrane protein YtaF [Bacillus badius]TDW02045.1 putative sporulation protein YtaF [Bacillus badius]UAT29817.1 sporulation membrane protein YtaF [Bacillus badius]GLY10238.1 sporulation membrane protein YtaF [Bacillus badius]
MDGYLSLFMLAAAVSLDSFSAGLAYGLKKLNLPMKSSLILSLCSATALLIAMGAGHWLSRWFSEQAANRLGGTILIALGAWVLWQFFREGHKHEQSEEKPLIHLELKRLGVVIHIFKRPTAADLDQSGTINGLEALLLGFALSLDAFGAGLGAAMLSYPAIGLATAVAVMNLLFVTGGLACGRKFAGVQWVQRISFFPGILLIILGTLKI